MSWIVNVSVLSQAIYMRDDVTPSPTQACYTGTLNWPNFSIHIFRQVPIGGTTKTPLARTKKIPRLGVWVWRKVTSGGAERTGWQMNTHACQIQAENKFTTQKEERTTYCDLHSAVTAISHVGQNIGHVFRIAVLCVHNHVFLSKLVYQIHL